MPIPAATVRHFLDDADLASLRQALSHSRRWLAGRPAEEPLVFGPRTVTAGELTAAFDQLAASLAADPDPQALAAEVAERFEGFACRGGEDGRMLVTGYYEPVIAGSLVRRPGYPVPIYGTPPDLIQLRLRDFSDTLPDERLAGRLEGRRLVPYPDRREIRRGGHLAGREIAWARDVVDLFFLEIQGSGTLRLPDGREVRIGYAAANGRPYRSIGRLLIDEGRLEREEVSLQSIRAFLARHPEEVERVLDHNGSQVFFRRLDGPPLGSLGVPVTAGRTVATDPRLFPPGALAFLVTERPAAEGGEEKAPLARFVLNQDAGGAVRGPGRVDLFWGKGAAAGEVAGRMKEPGRLFFLAPRRQTEAPLEARAPARPAASGAASAHAGTGRG